MKAFVLCLNSLDVNSAFAFTKKYGRCFGGSAEALAKAGLAHRQAYSLYAEKILMAVHKGLHILLLKGV